MTKNNNNIKVKLVPKASTKKKKSKTKQMQAQEMTRLGSALRMLGSYGGGALGSMVGFGSAGSGVGHDLGASLSRWLGSGDYKVAQNSIVNKLEASGSVPTMHKENQTIIVRHKEYLGEIRGKQNFTVVSQYPLNPGVRATFPWLARVASCYQEYRFRGVVIHYVPTSGESVSSTNAALGSVMIQTSYRSNDAQPTSKVELLNEYCSSESKPSEAFCHPIECDPRENPFNIQYVRSGAIPAGDSVLLYDLGVTTVAVSGQQVDDKTLGDLWITYEVELKKPIVNSNVTETVPGAQLTITSVASSITGASLFDGTVVRQGAILATVSGNTITIPVGWVGDFLITVNTEATTTFSACNFSAVATLTNCTLGYVTPGAQVIRTVLGGTTPTLNRFFYEVLIRIVEPTLSATITVPSGTLTGTALATNLTIVQVE